MHPPPPTPVTPKELEQTPNLHSPLQAEDAVEERVLWGEAVHNEHAAQHVKVEVVLGQRAGQPGFEEGRPTFLQG